MLGAWGFVSGVTEWMPQLDWQDQLEVWGFAALNAGNDDNHSHAQCHLYSESTIPHYCLCVIIVFVIFWLLGYFPG